jgi:hypothetical protein
MVFPYFPWFSSHDPPPLSTTPFRRFSRARLASGDDARIGAAGGQKEAGGHHEYLVSARDDRMGWPAVERWKYHGKSIGNTKKNQGEYQKMMVILYEISTEKGLTG